MDCTLRLGQSLYWPLHPTTCATVHEIGYSSELQIKTMVPRELAVSLLGIPRPSQSTYCGNAGAVESRLQYDYWVSHRKILGPSPSSLLRHS